MPRHQSVAGTGTDPTIEFAKLEVDGKEYRLAYNFNAIAEAEEISGCNLLQGLVGMGGSWTAKQMRGLLYAAIHIAHPRVTITEAGDMVRLDTMVQIQEALISAYSLSLPEAKRLQIENPPEGEPAAGSSPEASATD